MRVKSTHCYQRVSRRTSIQTLLLMLSQGLWAHGKSPDETGLSIAGLFGSAMATPGRFRSVTQAFFAGTAPALGITTFDDAVDPTAFNTSAGILPATASPTTVFDIGNPSLYPGVGIKATGWDMTITASAGNVTASFSGGGETGGTSDYCIRANRSLGGATLNTVAYKSDDGSLFHLLSVYMKVNMVPNNTASLTDITLTGYKSGSAVSGATLTITNIQKTTWTLFDVTANSNFTGIDEFRFSTAPASGVVVNSIFVDQIALPVTPLPLVLIIFSGDRQASDAILQWETATEQNTSRFQVQRSTPGTAFMAIGEVPAAGNSDLPRQYHFTDADAFSNPSAGDSGYLYRLKMIDLDGRFTYSPVVRIGSAVDNLSVSAWPNPFQEQLSVFVQSPEADVAQLSLRDMSGKLLQSKQMNVQKGSNVLQLSSLSQLERGAYLLTIATRAHQQTITVMKMPG